MKYIQFLVKEKRHYSGGNSNQSFSNDKKKTAVVWGGIKTPFFEMKLTKPVWKKKQTPSLEKLRTSVVWREMKKSLYLKRNKNSPCQRIDKSNCFMENTKIYYSIRKAHLESKETPNFEIKVRISHFIKELQFFIKIVIRSTKVKLQLLQIIYLWSEKSTMYWNA